MWIFLVSATRALESWIYGDFVDQLVKAISAFISFTQDHTAIGAEW